MSDLSDDAFISILLKAFVLRFLRYVQIGIVLGIAVFYGLGLFIIISEIIPKIIGYMGVVWLW